MTRRTHNKALIAIAIAVALAVPSLTLIAQPARNNSSGNSYGCPGFGKGYYGHQPFRHLDRMQYYLGLTDQQVEKIFNINQEYRAKFFKNRKSFDAIQKLHEEKYKDIEKVLTEEQKKKFNKMNNFKNRSWRHHRGPGGGSF